MDQTGFSVEPNNSSIGLNMVDDVEMAHSFPVPPSAENPVQQDTSVDVEILADQIERIPDRMAFKIGDVANMVGVKTYVLRYWESEFDALHPKKSRNKQRIYTRRDVETVLMIKKLLYEDRFSVEGAKAALKKLKQAVKEERQWRAVVSEHDRITIRARRLLQSIVDLKRSIA